MYSKGHECPLFETRLSHVMAAAPAFAPLAPRAARVAHEQQFGALHAVWVVVALRDDVAGVCGSVFPGLYHAGAELEPAKGDSGVKR